MKKLYPRLTVACFLLCILSIDRVKSQSNASFISKPTNRAVNVAAPTVKITASVAAGARRYTIQISTTPDFSYNVISRTSTHDYQRTMVFSALAYGTTYYARAASDVSDFGRVTTFRTKDEEFPEIMSPVNNATDANPVVLEVPFKTIAGASDYTLELSTKHNFQGNSVVLKTSLKDQSVFIVKNLAYNKIYYARLKSDVNTRFGSVIKFTTRKEIAAKRLWALTTAGGAHDAGTVISFSVDSATLTKHHDYLEFSDYPNAYAEGDLTHAPDNGFYGTSECERNGTCGNGEIFHINRFGEFTLLASPGIHQGSVVLASNGQLYALHDWINIFRGGIIRVPAYPASFELSQIIFEVRNRNQGLNPRAQLLELPDGFLYSMAPTGGVNDSGVIYRIKPDGKNFQVIFNFDAPVTGANPQSHLIRGSDGRLYGTTFTGGQYGLGTLFSLMPDGSDFRKLIDFAGTNGAHPYGAVTESNGRLYGMTTAGGSANKGVMYKFDLEGQAPTVLVNFAGPNGAMPLGAPTVVGNFVYGMTSYGGVYEKGVIFRVHKTGSAFQKLSDLTAETGSHPSGSLLLAEDFFPAKANNPSDDQASAVSIYPNPFTTSFTAQLASSEEESVHWLISDLQGNILEQHTGVLDGEVSLGEKLNKGVYILKIVRGQKVTLLRIVKK